MTVPRKPRLQLAAIEDGLQVGAPAEDEEIAASDSVKEKEREKA